jgi:two-component system, response regulator PdtaR
MKRTLSVAAADDERTLREYYQELLPRLGHQVAVAETGRQLVELCRAGRPDLVITDIRMPDMEGIAAAAEVNRDRPVPIILVSAHSDPTLRAQAHEEYIMAYLVKPVKAEDLDAAIDLALKRFEQFQALRQEATDLRQALEDRKVIERAKGALMRRLGVDEGEAFRRLRKLSSDHNRKLVDVSRSVLASEEVFRALDVV